MIASRLAAFALTLLLASSCKPGGASTPSAPAPDRRAFIASIEVCTATEAALHAELGPPTRDGRLHGARVVSWIISDGDVTAYLAVLLAPDGRVVDLYWDVPTEIPWTPTDQCAPR